jgi:hypothetical protein
MDLFDSIENNDIETILYSDDHITLTNKSLSINNYYYPLNKVKQIPIEKIKKITLQKLGTFTGKNKFYGLSLNGLWFHFDRKRPLKENTVIIDNGSLIKTAITPNDINKVYNILKQLIKKNS